MKEIQIVAKTKGADGKESEIKGTCKQYSNTAEAVKDLTEERVLGIVNMQVKIRALDALRKGTSVSIAKLFKGASKEAQDKIKALLEAEAKKAGN